MTSPRPRPAVDIVVLVVFSLLAFLLLGPGCFGCGGLLFEGGAPPAGFEQDAEATLEAAVVWFTLLASLAAGVLVGGDVLIGRRSA